MRTTLSMDDALLDKAGRFTGIRAKPALIHLLAAVQLTPGASLGTRDKRLA